MSNLLQLLKETGEKCNEYQKIARECQDLKRKANKLLVPHSESLGGKLKEIAERAYPPLLRQDYQGMIISATQLGIVNVQIMYNGWFTTKEAVTQSAALDEINKEFKKFAAELLGVPEERINPTLNVHRTG